MNHARKEIGVEEAIDYLKSINAPFWKNFDGRGMVISNIDTGTDYRHKAMRIDDDAKDSMRFKKENLKGTDKNFWLSDKIPHAFNYYNGGKITVEKLMMEVIILIPMGCILQGFLREMILKKTSKTLTE